MAGVMSSPELVYDEVEMVHVSYAPGPGGVGGGWTVLRSISEYA